MNWEAKLLHLLRNQLCGMASVIAIVLCIKYHDKFYLTEKKDIFLMHLLVIRMTGKQKVLYISMIEFLQDLQICPIVRFI